MPGSQTMLVLCKLPRLHWSQGLAVKSAWPVWRKYMISRNGHLEVHTLLKVGESQRARPTGHSCTNMHGCPYSVYLAVPLNCWGRRWLLCGWGCQNHQCLHKASQPCGQLPVQHLQLASGLAFAPEVSASRGSAAALTAQERPAALPGLSPTTGGETVGRWGAAAWYGTRGRGWG